MSDRVTQALLITVNVAYDAIYGGETLLNRALIALSKSGLHSASIVCTADQREKITAQLRLVAHRLLLRCDVVEKRTEESLAHVIIRATQRWQDTFCLFTVDAIVHPTLFSQARQ